MFTIVNLFRVPALYLLMGGVVTARCGERAWTAFSVSE
jgi:hypothetical protein